MKELKREYYMRMSVLLIGVMLLLPGLTLRAWAQEPSRIGLNTTLHSFKEDIKSLQKLGVSTIRMPLQWESMKISPGEYDWRTVDRFVNEAHADRIDVLFNIRTTFSTKPKKILKRGVIQTSPQINPPSMDAEEWVRFAKNLANRYRGQGVNYEIENEVNELLSWKGRMDEYLELLKAGYDAIKKADPKAKVLPSAMGCGITYYLQLGSANQKVWKWHDRWLEPILSTKKFDVVNVHNYYFPSEIAANETTFHSYLEHIRDMMKKSGLGDRPIWITETGFVAAPTNASGRVDNGSPEKQSMWLKEAYEEASQSGVERMYWLLIRDRKEPYFGSMGLADAKGEPRPVWNTVKQFTQRVEDK